jgi:hypothetical protein
MLEYIHFETASDLSGVLADSKILEFRFGHQTNSQILTLKVFILPFPLRNFPKNFEVSLDNSQLRFDQDRATTPPELVSILHAVLLCAALYYVSGVSGDHPSLAIKLPFLLTTRKEC